MLDVHNANSPIGSNLSFLRYKYGINFQSHSLAHCLNVATSVEQLHSQCNCLIATDFITNIIRTRCNEICYQ